MIQSGLYFVLGFLVAGFLALLVAPTIWRRAVFLTRKRIESAVPLTANELQADKDKLRAEHAMSVRKVEIALDKQREKTTAQATEINELKEQIKLLKVERESQMEANTQLEKVISMHETKAQARTQEIDETKFQLSTTSAELSARTGELESLQHLYRELETNLSDSTERNKLDGLQIAKLTTTVADLKSKREDDRVKVREIRADGRATAELLKNERARIKDIEKRYERLVSQKSDIEDRLTRREKELVRLREKQIGEDADAQEMEQRLVDSEAERASLEREVSQLTLAVNRIEKAAGDAKPEKAIEMLKAQNSKLELDVKKLKDERDDLKKKLKERPVAAPVVAAAATQAISAKPVTAKINAGDEQLRAQLKQLAAEVVYMTALVEGDGSPINEILKDAEAAPDKSNPSLAERIKVLKEAADAKR